MAARPNAPAAFRWLGRHDVPNKLMNVAVSSVIGPRERGHFGGAAVTEIYSTGALSPNCSALQVFPRRIRQAARTASSAE
jgi:hypothetical protein